MASDPRTHKTTVRLNEGGDHVACVRVPGDWRFDAEVLVVDLDGIEPGQQITPIPLARSDAEVLAQRFHETYERLAPDFGYKTRKASAVPWKDVPADNKRLMTAVAEELITEGRLEWLAGARRVWGVEDEARPDNQDHDTEEWCDCGEVRRQSPHVQLCTPIPHRVSDHATSRPQEGT